MGFDRDLDQEHYRVHTEYSKKPLISQGSKLKTNHKT